MTSDFFILDNPYQGSVHTLIIPTDSVVYIGYRTDSYPNIVFPFPSLSGDELDYSKGQIWANKNIMYTGGMQIPAGAGIVKPDESNGDDTVHTLVGFRLWTGHFPFQKTFTVTANGFSRTGSGTVTRTIYQRPNGETYMIDVCPDQTGTNSIPCYLTYSSESQPQNDGLVVQGNKVWRDSEGNIIGGSLCEFYWRSIPEKVGPRVKNVAHFHNITGTQFGECPTDGTQVGDSTTVEVSDGILEPATPITFTLNLNVVEKSYSYIHF